MSAVPDETRFVIYGAGAIGGYLGGTLIAAGYRVAFVRRQSFVDATNAGFVVQDRQGRRKGIAAESRVLIDPADISESDIVLVTVKSGATAAVAAELNAVTPTSIISIQNGIRNVAALRESNPDTPVIAAMIPFNVVRSDDASFSQATKGTIVLGPGGERLAHALRTSGLDSVVDTDVEAIQAGKLLMNLNNAIHALSGRSLVQELSSRQYRVVLAAAQKEALKAFRLHHKPVVSPLPGISARLIPTLLQLPDLVFTRIARTLLSTEGDASSSLSDDLLAGKKTEVRYLNGEIVAMLEDQSRSAPVNQALVQLVESAETYGPSPISGPHLRQIVLGHKSADPQRG